MKTGNILFVIIAVYFWGVVLGQIPYSTLWIIPMVIISAIILGLEEEYINKDEE